MSDWNPAQYLAFAGPRLRPGLDLIARLDHPGPKRIVDLGAGTGELTALLQRRWPKAEIRGVDSSPAMLAKARAAFPDIAWEQADVAAWTPEEPLDVVYANACLQWLPDHETLFPRLLSYLAPGGVFACQMPRNFAAPSHALLRETAAEGPWAQRLALRLREEPVASPAAYHDLLAPRCKTLEIWETEYLLVLSGEDPVLEWTKGTALTPVFATLGGAESDDFLARYRVKLRAAYPRRADGTTLFPFRRIFMVASV